VIGRNVDAMNLADCKKNKKLRIGLKQSMKAISEGLAEKLIIARDADQYVTRGVLKLAEEHGVRIEYCESMKALGKACEIDVGAATAVIIK